MDKDNLDNRFRLECECGSCSLVFQHYPDLVQVAEDEVIYIHYEIDQWYAEKGLFEMIIERIKLAWKVLTGRKHFLFELGIKEYQLKDFRNFINKVILETKLMSKE